MKPEHNNVLYTHEWQTITNNAKRRTEAKHRALPWGSLNSARWRRKNKASVGEQTRGSERERQNDGCCSCEIKNTMKTCRPASSAEANFRLRFYEPSFRRIPSIILPRSSFFHVVGFFNVIPLLSSDANDAKH